MTQAELPIAIEWARKEGWNPGLEDNKCFYATDPQGFFLGLLDDEPIATGSAVAYDNHFAFCGFYIVKPEYRKKGYGIQLTHERLKYVGNRITGIDGVVENVSKYQKIGYQPAHKNSRYRLDSLGPFSISKHIFDVKILPFEQLENFDKDYFPAPRPHFLKCWINQANGHCLGYVEGQKLRGYGVIRKCFQGHKIGPLFAESPTIAQALFEALCAKVKEGPVYLDIPEPNPNAQALVNRYKMTSQFEVIRMYRNGMPTINLQGIYGITTFELG